MEITKNIEKEILGIIVDEFCGSVEMPPKSVSNKRFFNEDNNDITNNVMNTWRRILLKLRMAPNDNPPTYNLSEALKTKLVPLGDVKKDTQSQVKAIIRGLNNLTKSFDNMNDTLTKIYKKMG